MYADKRILGLIPARAGSKGIKDKNIVDLAGKPLIAYSIEAGLGSQYVDDVVVSTDGQQIANVAIGLGADVPFLRPAEYATDKAKTIDAVLHAVRALSDMGREYDALVLLQPTQPLRTAVDIDAALEQYFEEGMMPLASVSPVTDNPLLIRSIGANGMLRPLLDANSTCRRQDMPSYYRVNGCIYINAIAGLNENTSFNDNPLPYIMDASHSVDIDDLIDLAVAEALLLGGE